MVRPEEMAVKGGYEVGVEFTDIFEDDCNALKNTCISSRKAMDESISNGTRAKEWLKKTGYPSKYLITFLISHTGG
jgi:hypothetical protein